MSKKKSHPKKEKGDWQATLASLKEDMIDNFSEEEKQEYQLRQQQEKKKKELIKAANFWFYTFFLPGYKVNSGIFINNFFRKRTYADYLTDVFEDVETGIDTDDIVNLITGNINSLAITRELYELEKQKIAYFPIDGSYIRCVYAVATLLEYSQKTKKTTIFYRGCSTLDRNGVNGIVSVTTDLNIARQFSRGTILKIHVPAGTKYLNLKDSENEILLPPCDYKILSRQVKENIGEMNNRNATTNIMEIEVKPLDLLEEFRKVMLNPPQEYSKVYEEIKYQRAFEEALILLEDYMGMTSV